MKAANGVTTYLVANAFDGGQFKRDDTPPLAQEFIGDPQVTFDVYPSGRVDFFVQQQVKMRVSGTVVNDIYRVKVPKVGKPSVKRYPKPIGLTSSLGPKAPPIWPSSKEIPDEAIKTIEAAIPSIWGELDGPKQSSLVRALNSLKIEFEITPRAKATSKPYSLA